MDELFELITEDEVIEVEEVAGYSTGDSVVAALNDKVDALNNKVVALDAKDTFERLYTTKKGVADYYLWESVPTDGGVGLFVTLCEDSGKIRPCTGYSVDTETKEVTRCEVFGVTVSDAAFVGGKPVDQTDHALVATAGMVAVRSTGKVVVGDYVVSDSNGFAKKAECGSYGYKVAALAEENEISYVVIDLKVSANQLDMIGETLKSLANRLTTAEANTAVAVSNAQQAIDAASRSEVRAEETDQRVNDAMDDIADNAIENITSAISGTIAGLEATVNDAQEQATRATEKANETAKALVTLTSDVERLETDTQTQIAGIMNSGDEIISSVSSVDKYSVGEYSQSYGLTNAQAQSILKAGMIYIPTEHINNTDDDADGSHQETFSDTDEINSFSPGFYYTWNGADWIESGSAYVMFSGTGEPSGNEVFKYWYVNSHTAPEGYEPYALYVAEYNEEQDIYEWKKVNVLSGNVNNRMVSMVRQTADEVAMEVVNARGSMASLGAKIDDVEATASLGAFWKNPESGVQNLALVKAQADETGSTLELAVMDASNPENPVGSGIILKQQTDGSSSMKFAADSIDFTVDNFTIDADHINFNAAEDLSIDANKINFEGYEFDINADNINLEGYVTFDNLREPGQTIIDGANIIAGSVGADQIAADAIKSSEYFHTEGVYSDVGTFLDLESGNIYSPNFAINSGGAYIKGNVIATTGEVAGWDVVEDRISKNGVGISSGNVLFPSVTDTSVLSPIRFYVGNIDRASSAKTIEIHIPSGNRGQLYTKTIALDTGDMGLYQILKVECLEYDEEYSEVAEVTSEEVTFKVARPVYTDNLEVPAYYKGEIIVQVFPIETTEIAGKLSWTMNGGTDSVELTYVGNGQVKVVGYDNLGGITMKGTITGEYIIRERVNPDIQILDNKQSFSVSLTPQTDKDYYLTFKYVLVPVINYAVLGDGSLYAEKAWITGRIDVNQGGTIGEFHIGDSSIYKNKTSYDDSKNGVYIGTDGIGLGSGKFYVTSEGTMHAEGNIKVSSGVIQDGVYFGTNEQIRLQEDDSGIKIKANANDSYVSVGINSVSLTSGGVQINGRADVSIQSETGVKIGHYNLPDAQNYLYGTWKIQASSSDSASTVTSDQNKKHDIEFLDERYDALFDKLQARRFKYNDGTSNRYHIGYVAQEVQDSLAQATIPENEFAGVVTYNEGTEDEERGLRYDEFISLNTWQIQKLKARVAELETKLNKLLTAQND